MKETVDLGGGYTLFQPEGVYPCGTDAVLLAAFAALLQRVTGSSDVPVGTPIANRGRGEVEGLIGFFIPLILVFL